MHHVFYLSQVKSLPLSHKYFYKQIQNVQEKDFCFHFTAHRSLQARLSILDFAELFNLALVHVLL